jgi:hypothetical protein
MVSRVYFLLDLLVEPTMGRFLGIKKALDWSGLILFVKGELGKSRV